MGDEIRQCNIASLCTTIHCTRELGDRLAMRWVDADLNHKDYTFNDLEAESNRMANLLRQLGVQPGDRVAVFLPKLPEVFFGILGILKIQAIACPLFSNFGEDALIDRLGDAGVKVVISKKSLLRKLNNIREKIPTLQAIILLDVDEHQADQVYSLPFLRAAASPFFETPDTLAETPSLLHYTSGSTGKPKGVLHHHRAASLIRQTGEQILQIQPDDLYWCTADQAWITGTSYGIFAPWLIGAPQLHYSGPFSADTWCHILEKFRVKLWYTAPTVLRMMI